MSLPGFIAEICTLGPEQIPDATAIALVLRHWPQWQKGGILSVDPARGLVSLDDQLGSEGLLFEGLPRRWPLALSPVAKVLESGLPFFTADMRREEAFTLYRLDAEAMGYRSVALFPLMPPGAEHPRILTLHAAQALSEPEAAIEDILAAARLVNAWQEIGHRMGALAARRLPVQDALSAQIEGFLAGAPAGLRETAAQFAASGGRYQGTADLLGIHITTLRYRLERIADRHGLDLREAGIRNRFVMRQMLEEG